MLKIVSGKISANFIITFLINGLHVADPVV
jgi:hypothetical protein